MWAETFYFASHHYFSICEVALFIVFFPTYFLPNKLRCRGILAGLINVSHMY